MAQKSRPDRRRENAPAGPRPSSDGGNVPWAQTAPPALPSASQAQAQFPMLPDQTRQADGPDPAAHQDGDGQRRDASNAPTDRAHDRGNGNQGGHGGHGGEEVIPKDLPKVSRTTVFIVGAVVAVALVALFILGWLPRHRTKEALAKDVSDNQNDVATVDVATPKRMEATTDLLLPGDARPMQETALFARTNGYLKRWYFDIDDHVTTGQLLAEIEAPEVDADLNQAIANRDAAKANVVKAQNDYDLAKATLERFQGLIPTGGVTQQQLDEKKAAASQALAVLDAAKAAVAAGDATVQRLTAQQGFEKVTAPFTGTITARNYDVGALISPGGNNAGAANSAGAGKELFRLAETDTLRIFVNVPQSYVTQVKRGSPCEFLVRNYPGRPFVGTVARSSGAIDPATRTLLTEIHIPNKDATLWAGMYGQVKFKITYDKPPLTIPTSAIIFAAEGTQVAAVADGKVHFKKILLGRDFGREAEVTEGLDGDEQIVANPGEKLSEGADVKVAAPDQKDQKDQKAAAGPAAGGPNDAKPQAQGSAAAPGEVTNKAPGTGTGNRAQPVSPAAEPGSEPLRTPTGTLPRPPENPGEAHGAGGKGQ